MKNSKRLLLLLALLMTAATGAWAQDAKHSITATYDKQTRSLEQPLPYETTVGELFEAVTGHSFSDLISTMSLFDKTLTEISSTKTDVVSIGELNGASTPVTVKADGKATIGLNFSGFVQGIYVNVVPPPLYVTMADGTKDADKWTVKVGDGEAKTLPVGELSEGNAVTLNYKGRLKVKNVTATTDPEPDPLATPLTVEALTAGTIVVNIVDGYGDPKTLSTGMKYSVNGGTKTTITETTSIEGLKAGDKVQFYGNGTQTQVYGDNPAVRIQGSGDGFQTKVYGNIMSLLDEEGFATKTDLPNAQYVFYGLFKNNATLIDASELLLPAATLAQDCYREMFNGCSALTAAPVLPATQLAERCYYEMFNGCSALTAAPALPATTLADYCYCYMFKGCTSLTEAPVLPATTLVSYCYRQMFNNCKKLATVTCLATSGINQDNSTNRWLQYAGSEVQGTKTFNAVSTAEWPEESVDGIPNGWTRVKIDN